MEMKSISNFPMNCRIAYYALVFPTGQQENHIRACLRGQNSETGFLHPKFGFQMENNYSASAIYLNRAHSENLRPDVPGTCCLS